MDAASAFRVWLLEAVLGQTHAARREREAMIARQNVLLDELDHRVKNTLARIHGLVRESKSSARSLEEFVSALEKRIIVMGNAHTLLADSHWDGVSLRGQVSGQPLISEAIGAGLAARSRDSHQKRTGFGTAKGFGTAIIFGTARFRRRGFGTAIKFDEN